MELDGGTGDNEGHGASSGLCWIAVVPSGGRSGRQRDSTAGMFGPAGMFKRRNPPASSEGDGATGNFVLASGRTSQSVCESHLREGLLRHQQLPFPACRSDKPREPRTRL